jgi:hypothetical protein
VVESMGDNYNGWIQNNKKCEQNFWRNLSKRIHLEDQGDLEDKLNDVKNEDNVLYRTLILNYGTVEDRKQEN